MSQPCVRNRTDANHRPDDDVALIARESEVSWKTMKRWLAVIPETSGVRNLLRPTKALPMQSLPMQSPDQIDPALTLAALAQRSREARSSPARGRVREWRRRALLRKGARLYSNVSWTSNFASLAMLDEDGIVVNWYERESRYGAHRSPVNEHVSSLYMPSDVAMGVPVRDLCSAAMNGEFVADGWRVGMDGQKFWATTTIRPVLLRDGRLQGFSHVTHRTAAPWRSGRALNIWPWRRRTPKAAPVSSPAHEQARTS